VHVHVIHQASYFQSGSQPLQELSKYRRHA
jgi:hypothetical protein